MSQRLQDFFPISGSANKQADKTYTICILFDMVHRAGEQYWSSTNVSTHLWFLSLFQNCSKTNYDPLTCCLRPPYPGRHLVRLRRPVMVVEHDDRQHHRRRHHHHDAVEVSACGGRRRRKESELDHRGGEKGWFARDSLLQEPRQGMKVLMQTLDSIRWPISCLFCIYQTTTENVHHYWW